MIIVISEGARDPEVRFVVLPEEMTGDVSWLGWRTTLAFHPAGERQSSKSILSTEEKIK